MTTPGQSQTRQIERRLGDRVRHAVPAGIAEFLMFILKQGWSALFGVLFVLALIASAAVWQEGWPIYRYDALFAFAVVTQVLMITFRLETWAEVRVILLFHVTGTAMEFFKVDAGSWAYPEEAIFKVLGVPLFSGFMYASVGSYIARVIRVFDMRFAPYPPFWVSLCLAVAIYVNFFAHHFLPDIRIVLFAATVIIYARTRIWFFVGDTARWMPLPVAAFLSALALWVAENVGTMTGTWIYAGQHGFDLVSLGKLGSWYLLLYVSFVTVTLVQRDALSREPIDQPGRAVEPV